MPSRSALCRNGHRFVSVTSRVRIGLETKLLVRKSAALNRKNGNRRGHAAATGTDRCPHGGVAGGLLAGGRSAVAGLGQGRVGVSLARQRRAPPTLFRFRGARFSRARRPFSGPTAVEVASPDVLGPDFPVQSGTRQRRQGPLSATDSTIQQGVCKRSFAGGREPHQRYWSADTSPVPPARHRPIFKGRL